MGESSSCLNNRCFTVTEGSVAQCPVCGALTMSARQVRTRGWLLLATGLFLVAFVGVTLWFVAPMMLRPLPEGSDGGAAMIPLVFALFAGLAAVGLAAAVVGVQQARAGRRSRRGLTVMLAIIAITMLAAWIGVGLLGGGARGPVPVPL